MDPRLTPFLDLQRGLVLRRQAESVGVMPADLARLVRTGEIERVRRGVFARPIVDDGPARPTLELVRRVRAALMTHPQVIATHQSAAALHGLPLFDVDLSVVDLAGAISSTTRRGDLRIRPMPPGGPYPQRFVPPALACVQLAASSHVAAVVAMDAALNRRLVTRADLDAAAGLLPRARRTRAAAAVGATDPGAESVGETRTRLALRTLARPVRSQVELRDAHWLARVHRLLRR